MRACVRPCVRACLGSRLKGGRLCLSRRRIWTQYREKKDEFRFAAWFESVLCIIYCLALSFTFFHSFFCISRKSRILLLVQERMKSSLKKKKGRTVAFFLLILCNIIKKLRASRAKKKKTKENKTPKKKPHVESIYLCYYRLPFLLCKLLYKQNGKPFFGDAISMEMKIQHLSRNFFKKIIENQLFTAGCQS